MEPGMKNEQTVRSRTQSSNRRHFLKGSAAGFGTLVLRELLDVSSGFGSSFAHPFTNGRLSEKGSSPSPIKVSWFSTGNGTPSLRLKTGMLPNGPDVIVNIEGCLIGVLPGVLSPSYADSNRVTNPFGVSVPFCVVTKIDEQQSSAGLGLVF